MLKFNQTVDGRKMNRHKEMNILIWIKLFVVSFTTSLAFGSWQAQWITAADEPTIHAVGAGGYHAALAEQNETKWVQIDLRRSYAIERIILHPVNHEGVKGFGFPTRFRVDVSDNEVFGSYQALADRTSRDVPNPGEVPVVFDADRIQGRYVRVTATQSLFRESDRRYIFALARLEVMADGVNRALHAPVTALDSVEDYGWSKTHLTSPPKTAPDTWLCYRHRLNLDAAPEQAVARIACDSKYWLWINGRLAVYEGQLHRGPTPRDTYYDRVVIAPFLTKGENSIAVLMWHFGREGYNHKNSGRAGLVFEADIDGSQVISDPHWKARVHPAFGQTGQPHPNYRLPAGNIHFDARKDISGWHLADYDDTGWPQAITMGRPPAAPWNELVLRPLPLWRVDELTAYENADQLPTHSTGEPIIASLPRNITISPYLKINAPAGLKIDIRTDNYKGGSEYNYRSEYITSEGVQEFESIAYLNGHWVIYDIPKGVELLSMKYRQTRYDTDVVGCFECDDPFFNTLWQKALYTMNVNMRDAIQDPDRERAQWWGDVVIVLGQILYSCDTRGHDAIKKAIYNLVDWQKSDGVLFSPIPAGSWDKELPGQMLASIGMYGFWYYYRYTDDSQTLKHAYPAVRKYLSLWQLGDDGLVVHRPGGWDWGDWGENKDRPVMLNAWYYMALQSAVRMAELTGHRRDIPAYQARINSIKENFNKYLWTGRQYRSGDYHGQTDDRGHGLAVVAGLTTPDQWPAIRRVLETEFHASPYTEKYVLESLFHMRHAEGALNRMKSRYKNMVESYLTTLWEGWGIGPEGYGGGSYNHGWAGGPMTLMQEYVAGIAPVEPGFKRFSVLPQMGYLNKVNTVVPTINGQINLKMAHRRADFEMYLTVPAGTAAVVGVPKDRGDYSAISVNLQTFWQAGKVVAAMDGIDYLGTDQHYHRFQAAAGRWAIQAEKKAP
jgi:alpha-L-rhamnosidase